jgi:hypothetical protein
MVLMPMLWVSRSDTLPHGDFFPPLAMCHGEDEDD